MVDPNERDLDHEDQQERNMQDPAYINEVRGFDDYSPEEHGAGGGDPDYDENWRDWE